MDREEIRRHVSEVMRAALDARNPSPSAASPADAAPVVKPPVANATPPTLPVPAARSRGRQLIVEEDVYRARAAGAPIYADAGALFTPLARETSERLRVQIVERRETALRVALASDHAGFDLKTALKPFLEAKLSVVVEDLGTHSKDAVDYPDLAHVIADAISSRRFAMAILVDASGIASAIPANRHPGVRAAPCPTVAHATTAREHNDANVLCLGSQFVTAEQAQSIIEAFLTTPFGGGRHLRRVNKIETTTTSGAR